jgi:hypothetical protein
MDEELKPDDLVPDPTANANDPSEDRTRTVRRVPKPFTMRPRLQSTNAKPNAPEVNIQGPRSAAPQVTTVPEKDAPNDAGQRAARNEQRQRALFGNSAATPLEKRPRVQPNVPHWLQGISVPDGPPAKRAEKGIEGLMRTIEHADLKPDIRAKWLFHFLNLLADPALDDYVGAAVASLATKSRPTNTEALGYLNSAMRSLAQRSEFLGASLPEQKSKRIAAILNLWEKIKGPLVVPAELLEVAEYNKLTLALQSMELPAPVPPPPPPRAFRRELPTNNDT